MTRWGRLLAAITLHLSDGKGMPEEREELFLLDNGSSCSRTPFSLRAHCYPSSSQGRMYFSDLKRGGYKNDVIFQ